MKTKTLIIIAIVAVAGYILFIKKKGCKCTVTGCTCAKKSADTPAEGTEASAPASTEESYSGDMNNMAHIETPNSGRNMDGAYATL